MESGSCLFSPLQFTGKKFLSLVSYLSYPGHRREVSPESLWTVADFSPLLATREKFLSPVSMDSGSCLSIYDTFVKFCIHRFLTQPFQNPL
jgi:hypothetical protein